MEINKCFYCMEDMGENNNVCPHCGMDNQNYSCDGFTLPPNTILHGKYLVGKSIGRGGFGITYIGYDLSLNIKVAIKEYFPMYYADRNSTSTLVSWSRTATMDGISQNKENFLKEARKMAKVDQLPGTVRVREIFLENETAYIVMDYVDGITIKNYMAQHGPLAPDYCLSVLHPIINSLDQLHHNGIIHRDISPDNIMFNQKGEAKLLDLGAAKEMDLRSNQDKQSSQMIHKDGFSPPEQYTTGGNIGPWTDVYAMCATIYYCITGNCVPSSMNRMISHTPVSYDKIRQSGMPDLVKVLEKGLSLNAKDRYQSMAELSQALPNQRELSDTSLNPEHETTSVKKGYRTASTILWIADFIMVVFFVSMGFTMAYMSGAMGVGALLGLIPRYVARKKGKINLSCISWPIVAIANTLLGLFGSIPTIIVLFIIIFVRKK